MGRVEGRACVDWPSSVASDHAMRSLATSHKLLGTREWFVIHHTNCGMELFTDEIIRDLFDQSLQAATFDGSKWTDPATGGGSAEARYIDWLTIKTQAASVVEDVTRIRRHPLVPPEIPATGTSTKWRPGSSWKSKRRPIAAARSSFARRKSARAAPTLDLGALVERMLGAWGGTLVYVVFVRLQCDRALLSGNGPPVEPRSLRSKATP